ncbi:lysylphosphatidylglycerol synthase transmembrane domain-containing protein [Salinisphaera sp.]|uniref:lysylphosphatidylglycerol synthase transmembrane domain-containing protein n=1 Tax=Salinisphaera sp. TaxID=1914330 RepID=UPI002D78F402|nr:lysylphosphatidylglycerol synthase transmembrane domain-containing protein [Salinisphaera sp.]HET7313790.1 lysylphosphatidylglycerol synthase transmembrane domain-containing protein [Salinisphaera sp.]
MPKNLMRALKIVVSAGLIAYLIYAVDWSSAVDKLRDANLSLVIVAAVIFMVNTVATSAWKWRISLRIHGFFNWRLLELGKILLIGGFMSSFLPTAIGGDIYRVYRTLPYDGQKSRAVSAVLLDRVTGLLSMFFVGALGALALYLQNQDPEIGFLALALAAPPLLAVAFPYLVGLKLFKPLLEKLAGIRKLEPLMTNARLVFMNRKGLARLSVVSVLFHILAVIAIAFLFAAVHTPGALAESAVADTMYSAAALIPVSINGLGIQEGSFAFTAQQLGISFSHAVIVALMIRIIAVLTSLCGGIVFFFDKGRTADLTMSPESIEQSD